MTEIDFLLFTCKYYNIKILRKQLTQSLFHQLTCSHRTSLVSLAVKFPKILFYLITYAVIDYIGTYC